MGEFATAIGVSRRRWNHRNHGTGLDEEAGQRLFVSLAQPGVVREIV